MKKTLLALATVLAVVSAVDAKDWDSIRVGVDAPYPPFEYKAPDGSLTGFEIELGDKVCMEVTGKACDWIIQAWDGIIPGLLARKYDMIFSSMRTCSRGAADSSATTAADTTARRRSPYSYSYSL